MTLFGMSPARLLANGAGALGGIWLSESFIVPNLPEGLFRIGAKRDAPGIGLDDVVTGVMAVIGAAAANQAFSKVQG